METPDNSINIRRLEVKHAEAYVEVRQRMLRRDPWAFGSSPSNDLECERRRTRELLASDDGAIVGAIEHEGGPVIATAGLFRSHHEKMAHWVGIWGVWTDPAHRGKGLARGVMLAAIDVASTMQGAVGVQLSVSERGVAARSLYESLGFTTWGTQPDAMRIGGESAAEHFMQVEFENVRRG